MNDCPFGQPLIKKKPDELHRALYVIVSDLFQGVLCMFVFPDHCCIGNAFSSLKFFGNDQVHAITPELLFPSPLYRCSKVFLRAKTHGEAGDFLRL